MSATCRLNARRTPDSSAREPGGATQYNRRMMPQVPQTPPTEIVPQPVREGIDVTINGKHFRHTGDPDLPLLWYLRDVLRLTGCKYGCDDASCGACRSEEHTSELQSHVNLVC